MLKLCSLFKICRSVRKTSLLSANFYTSKPQQQKKVAVVLSGSGMLDGSEIHEAAATAVHVAKLGMEPIFYAPNCPQDVVDHVKGCPTNETRCAFTESARIGRGKVCYLNDLQHCDVEAVIFPGGFGVAKTLSTYATDGENFALNEEVLRILNEFHDAKKPMGFMCISALLPAKLFCKVKITLGKKGDPKQWPHACAINAATQMGAEVEFCEVNEVSCDKQHLIFSTPAFMYEGPFNKIFDGIGNMIQNMFKTCSK